MGLSALNIANKRTIWYVERLLFYVVHIFFAPP